MKSECRMRNRVWGIVACAAVLQAGAQGTMSGTWTLVAVTQGEGATMTHPFGPGPKGILMLDPGGRFSVTITRADLPKFEAGNRGKGTADENRAVVQGSIAFFGTYTVNESQHVIDMKVEGSTYPNWIGTVQKRAYVDYGGVEMKFTNPSSSVGGGAADLIWKRVQ
jgi:hypothetical protein